MCLSASQKGLETGSFNDRGTCWILKFDFVLIVIYEELYFERQLDFDPVLAVNFFSQWEVKEKVSSVSEIFC